MHVSSPPITHSCFYGIDTPEQSELLASTYDLDAMARYIGVDTLSFISIDGLYRAVNGANRDADNPHYCDACFTGDYPIRLSDRESGPVPVQLSLLADRA
jgi:amidophosphoribosyltransferase